MQPLLSLDQGGQFWGRDANLNHLVEPLGPCPGIFFLLKLLIELNGVVGMV